MKTNRAFPFGLFALVSALLFGAGVPFLLFKDGLLHGHGSGSEVANGFVIVLIPMFAALGAVVGAISGALLGLIVWFIARVTARRS